MLNFRKVYFLLVFLFLNGVKGETGTTELPATSQTETTMSEETSQGYSGLPTATKAPIVLAPKPPIPTFLPLHHRYYYGQGHNRYNYGQAPDRYNYDYDHDHYYDYNNYGYNYQSSPYRHQQHHSLSNRHQYQGTPYIYQRPQRQQYYYQYPEHFFYWG